VTRRHIREGATQTPSFFVALAFGLGAILFFGGPRPAAGLDSNRAITQYGLDLWQKRDGLPQRSVSAIARTRDGYLWLGTEEGLVRFDGAKFRVYDSSNTPQLERPNVVRLLASRKGGLWVGTLGGGLVWTDGETFRRYTTRDGLSENTVSALLEDRDGSLWVGTFRKGLNHFVGGRFVAVSTRDGLSNDEIRALYQDEEGALWIGTRGGGVNRWRDGSAAVWTTANGLSNDQVTSLAGDGSGGVWIGTRRGLDRWSGGRTAVMTDRDGLSNDEVISLERDRDGVLWVGTVTGGLNRLAGGHAAALTKKEGLPDDTVLAILEDEEGNLWVGTDGGLSRLRAGPFLPVGTREGLPSDDVRPVLQTSKGELWVGTRGSGLSRRVGNSWKTYTHSDGLPSDRVWALHEDRAGDIWAGTKGGLAHFHAGRWTAYTAAQGLAADLVFAITTDAAGDLWVGTVGGLSRYRDGKFTNFGAADGLTNERVYALLAGSDGVLWIGTAGGGLDRMKDGRIAPAIAASEAPFIFALAEEPDGAILAGTGNRGLMRLSGARLARVGKADGLFDDTVYTILDDGRGFLWMSSNRGVFRVSREAIVQFAAGQTGRVHSDVFGTADGMRESECNGGFQPAGWRGRDGTLWFPTVAGLASVDPGRLAGPRRDPGVRLEEVFADAERLSPGKPSRLAPGRDRLEFRYTGIDFHSPGAVRFRYRLAGYDSDWIDAGDRRAAYYTNLPAGSYRFQAAASSGGGRWVETRPYEITLQAHFYRTPWFAAIAGICIVLGLAAIHRARMRSARLASELATARLEVLESQLQPHFLFNTLNLMLPLVHRDPDSAVSTIVKLGDLLRASMRRDAATLVPLHRELELLEAYLDIQKLRFAERLQTRIDVDQDLLDAGVPPFILQPFIENAIKHGVARRSKPTLIELSARREGERLRLTVSNTLGDSGAAESGLSSLGLGLPNARERLALVYGRDWNLSHTRTPGRFVVELLVPIERTAGDKPELRIGRAKAGGAPAR
jgi:ligand-binding sensor domain-containing protein